MLIYQRFNTIDNQQKIKNHPYGDRTRNSALRGRRLNQFDQRAIKLRVLEYRSCREVSTLGHQLSARFSNFSWAGGGKCAENRQ